MEIQSLCPFQLGTLLWEAQPGQFSLTVVIKATFVLTPGEVTVAPEQDPLGADRHWDNNPMASLYRPSDFAPAKKRVDLTLVGHAYAPGAREVTSVVARMQVGELSKGVCVTGDRLWVSRRSRPLEPGQPAGFSRVALRYERAQLGSDNLVGIDPNAPPSPGMHALPNLERVPGEAPGVACFGPIAPSWRARRRLLDESALAWAQGISSERGADAPRLAAAPAGFDFEFFNAAPRDQQLDLLRPGAPIVLEHLDPEHPRLETRLPPYRPQVFRVPPSATGRAEEIAVRCDTLWIDCDRGVVVLLWRGLADIARPSADAVGRLVVAADPQGKRLRWAVVEKRLGESVDTQRLSATAEPEDAEAPDPLAQRHDGLKAAPGPTPEIADPLTEEPTTMRHELAMSALSRKEPERVAIIEDEPTRDSQRRAHKITLPFFPPPAAGRPTMPTSPFPPPELHVSPKTTPPPAMPKLVDDPSTEDRTPPLPEPTRKPDPEQTRTAVKPQPIGVREYARIQLGLERGEVGKVLAELDLQLTDLVRIQRQWAVRVALNPALGGDLADAMDEIKKRSP